MNKYYRLVWNCALGMLVPVPEDLPGLSFGGRRRSRRERKLAWLAAAVSTTCLYPLPTLAQPVGGQTIAGQATIQQSDATTTITQTSQKAIINWQSFGIAANQSVNFKQPASSSVILNRVLGSDSSQIYGQLNANGQVFLVNPNGVLFAPGAQVNVGGLVASTKNITDQNFLSGNYKFSGSSSASVVNRGTIRAPPGGYVAFIGGTIDNEGTISTPGGTVALGAGGSVEMTLAGNALVHFAVSSSALNAEIKNGGAILAPNGAVILTVQAMNALLRTVVNNTGVIQADGVAQNGGVIELTGGSSGTVSVSGTVDASAPNGTGGQITVTGQQVVVQNEAKIIATGSVGGGTIAVGGGLHGGGNIPQAVNTTVKTGAVLNASATQNGNGGQISVWSDLSNPASTTDAYGTFLSMGGSAGGNGGMIETSGRLLNVTGATVNTSAPRGGMGTWLLDPYNVTVSSNGSTATTGINTAASSNSIISASSIVNALATTSVTIETAGTSGPQNGDITVNAPINWSAATALTLNAAGNININAAITEGSSSSAAGVLFEYGQSSAAGAGASLNI